MQVVFFNMWNICRGDMNTDLSGKPSEESGLSIVRALNWRYAIALALVAFLSTAAWFSLHLVISEQQSTAAIVNVSGRQRMLSQRTALFSNLLVNSPKSERSIIRGKLKESIELMALSHQGLTQGDDRQGLPDSMSPGNIANLILSDEPAFRVDFEGTPPPQRELYWRGLVLTETDGRSWRRGTAQPGGKDSFVPLPLSKATDTPAVKRGDTM